MKSCRLKWFPEVGTLNGPKGKVTFDSEAQFPPEVLSLNMPPLNAAIDLRGVKVSFVPRCVSSCEPQRTAALPRLPSNGDVLHISATGNICQHYCELALKRNFFEASLSG